MAAKEPRRPKETGRIITEASELGSSGAGGDTTVSVLVCAETEDQAILLEVMCYNLLSGYGFKGPANRRSFTGSHFHEADYQGMAERLQRHLLACFGNKRQKAGDLTEKERGELAEFEYRFREIAKQIEDETKSEYEEQKRGLETEISRLKDENARLRDQNTSQRIQELENKIQDSEKKSQWRKDPKFWITVGAVFLSLMLSSGDGSKAEDSGSRHEGTMICRQIPDEHRGAFKDAETDRGHKAKGLAKKIIDGYVESQSDEK